MSTHYTKCIDSTVEETTVPIYVFGTIVSSCCIFLSYEKQRQWTCLSKNTLLMEFLSNYTDNWVNNVNVLENDIQLSCFLWRYKLLIFYPSLIQCSSVIITQQTLWFMLFAHPMRFSQSYCMQALDTVPRKIPNTSTALFTEIPTIWTSTIWSHWNFVNSNMTYSTALFWRWIKIPTHTWAYIDSFSSKTEITIYKLH